MKKFLASILLGALLALPTVAVEYVPSPEKFDEIEVMVEPETEEVGEHYATIYNADGTVHSYIFVNGEAELVIYFLDNEVNENGERMFTIFSDGVMYEDRAVPEGIYEEILAAEKELLENDLVDIVEDFAEGWTERTGGAPVDHAKLAKVFDIRVIDAINDLLVDGRTLEISFKFRAIEEETRFAIIHKPEEAEKWIFENHTIDEDDVITLTVEKLSPFAILIDSGTGPTIDDDTPDSPQTGVAALSVGIAAGTVALLGGAVVFGKKAFRKNED